MAMSVVHSGWPCSLISLSLWRLSASGQAGGEQMFLDMLGMVKGAKRSLP